MITFNDYNKIISDESIILLQTLLRLYYDKQYDTILYIIANANRRNQTNQTDPDIINTRINLDSNTNKIFNILLSTTEKIMTKSNLINQIIEEFMIKNTPNITSNYISNLLDDNDMSYITIFVESSTWKRFVKFCRLNKIKVQYAFRSAIIDFLDDRYSKV